MSTFSVLSAFVYDIIFLYFMKRIHRTSLHLMSVRWYILTDHTNNNGDKRSSDTMNLNRSWEELLSGFKATDNEEIHSLADLGLGGDGLSTDDTSEGDIEIRDLSDLNLFSPDTTAVEDSPFWESGTPSRQSVTETVAVQTDLNDQSQALSKESSNNNSEKNTGIDKMAKKKAKKTKKPLWRRIIKWIFALMLVSVLAGGAFVTYVILMTPSIDTNNIYDMIHQPSVIYDDQGNELESVSTAELRENISIERMPQQLRNAFLAIEDKTFYEHHGFNVIRIIGAIKEGVFNGGHVSGTSTVTQQLAKNLYLSSERSLTRKIREAYYTVILEKNLTKDQILEAYLNCITFGYNSYGVEAAANSYFGKDVGDLTLAQCATLAAIPKNPSHNAPLKRYPTENVEPGNPNIILTDSTYTTVYNDGYKNRQELVLKNMLEQKMISQSEYDEAIAEDIRAELAPSSEKNASITSYFADYCISEVKNDLMREYKLDEKEASNMIYQNGLKIYSTLNVSMQAAAEEKFAISSNLPSVTGLRRDGNRNILNSSGKIILYNKDTYFNSDGSFTLKPGEYVRQGDGSLAILAGHRLNIYNTESNGTNNVQIEFKDLYTYQDNLFYCIQGGYFTELSSESISKDADGNAVISADFMAKNPSYFIEDADGINISSAHFTLRQMTIQPQAAMVVTDYTNGQIKVMVGGRSLKGRLLYNRAINPRQPGSSIKPIGVYGPAIQSGVEKNTQWTAGTTIEDSENIVNGRVWPHNWYSEYKGWITLRTCVEQSVNVPSVRLLNDIGTDYSVRYLKANGISTIVESGPVNDMSAAALALGGMTKGISPIEMASAYGTFPNGGEYVAPVSYTRIEDAEGNVLIEKKPYTKQVYDKGVAYIMTDILQTTVTRGIAGKAAFGSQPVGGKTGTTTDNYDAWFVGFTPQFSASVWIGNDVNIELSQGSSAAAALWSKVMKELTSGMPYGSFKKRPDNVYIQNGEFFVKGTSPSGHPVGKEESIADKYNILKDEAGNAYYIDENGTKIYLAIDPETGEYVVAANQPAAEPVPSNPEDPGTTEPDDTENPQQGTNTDSNGENENPSDNQNQGSSPAQPVNPSPQHGVINDN